MVDEITLHPRDNADARATHGRALWIMDHLEPIQSNVGADGGDGCATVLGSLRDPVEVEDDRNDEFWGHQFFTG